MSVERALIKQAERVLMRARLQEVLEAEARKGCDPRIAPRPLRLEPPYRSLEELASSAGAGGDGPDLIEAASPSEKITRRFQMWISPEQAIDYERARMLNRQLSSVRNRVSFEIVGNSRQVRFQLGCHHEDQHLVRAGFEGVFESSRLMPTGEGSLGLLADYAQRSPCLIDLFPPPPFYHLLTTSHDLTLSPLATVVHELSRIPPSAVGLYQVVFQPVAPEHDWHTNTAKMLDLSYTANLAHGMAGRNYPKDTPSSDLRHQAEAVVTKADPNEPFVATALRLAVFGEQVDAQQALESMAAFSGALQHQGRPLKRLSEDDYGRSLTPHSLSTLLHDGLVYRHGFLLNTAELSSLVHIPKGEVDDPKRLNMHRRSLLTPLERLPADESLNTGTYLGDSYYAGHRQAVYLPTNLRFAHLHLLGQQGQGKSTAMQQIILDDIERGDGVAVIDPHSDLVTSLLDRIPAHAEDRVVYISWSHSDVFPVWNPLLERSSSRARLVAELIAALRTFVTAGSWGDRLEHVLRLSVLGILTLPNPSLLDVADALRPKTARGRQLRDQVLARTDNRQVRRFWEEELYAYANSELSAPQHKLSKILHEGGLSETLSQRDSAFTFRELMDQQKIVLIDLSGLSGDLQAAAGSMMLSLCSAAGLSRSDLSPEERRPFHLHVDEAHNFAPESLESTLNELRKYCISLNLAHQRFSQLTAAQAEALRGTGSTLAFRVSSDDAERLVRGLQDRTDVTELVRLRRGEAIANIGGHVCRVHVPPPSSPLTRTNKDPIIHRSINAFYRKIGDNRVAGAAAVPNPTNAAALPDETAQPSAQETEFAYDEF